MRNEWSLECRQVGLDHLADCFAKPAAVNPADTDETRVGDDETMNSSSSTGATSPKERDDDDVSPMRLLIKNVKGTSCEPAKLRYLNGEGAFGVKHTGNGAFDAHLIGVRRVMQAWCPQKPHLHDAGLFHSIYGSEGFQGFCLPFEKRDELRSMIGEKAENLVYIFCVVDRLTVDNDLDSNPGRTRSERVPSSAGFPFESTTRRGSTSSRSRSGTGWSRWRAPRVRRTKSSSGAWGMPGGTGGARINAWRRLSAKKSQSRKKCTERRTRAKATRPKACASQ
jgi:hypothetical protein